MTAKDMMVYRATLCLTSLILEKQFIAAIILRCTCQWQQKVGQCQVALQSDPKEMHTKNALCYHLKEKINSGLLMKLSN